MLEPASSFEDQVVDDSDDDRQRRQQQRPVQQPRRPKRHVVVPSSSSSSESEDEQPQYGAGYAHSQATQAFRGDTDSASNETVVKSILRKNFGIGVFDPADKEQISQMNANLLKQLTRHQKNKLFDSHDEYRYWRRIQSMSKR